MPLPADAVARHVDHAWEHDLVDRPVEYVSIPNVSPAYDQAWSEHGHMERATELIRQWCRSRPIDGMSVEVLRLEGRTPVVLCEIPATDGSRDDTVLLYGHLDKQPEMTGWRDGLGPWTPVVEGDRLYGSGGADDGYAVFASLTAVEALRAAGGTHARLLVLIEASEESGSPDLPAHLDALGDRLGDVSLVVGLDSSAATYDRLWVTTSLRGVVLAELRVDVLTEGVHSGRAGGIVPSSFRLLRRLLDRIEDPDTGRVLVEEMQCPVPPERMEQLSESAAGIVGDMAFPWTGGTRPVTDDPVALLRARDWEASISTIAMSGFPPPERAGWNAPPTASGLADAVDQASRAHWGPPAAAIGEGGAIPFMAMLGTRFPDAQFLITGVLGPESNAHGPNEFLHLPTARRITAAVAHVLDAHARR